MKETHQQLVDSILTKVKSEAQENTPTEEQISQAEAIFALISSEGYLKSVLFHSQTGKSKLEVLLANGSIGESLILEVQTLIDDEEKSNYAARIKGAKIVGQRFDINDPTVGMSVPDESGAKEWFEERYNAFGWGVDMVSKSGPSWKAFLVRYFSSSDKLATTHGPILGEVLDQLQSLVNQN
ncbi:MAG: hypothetical protein HYV90_05140 [Candidatus Woesebacteria bacterium]|nr:MAG: hypothetical protein HYV90_05140 [Candidatus Woesebacteria bacterium]